MGAGLMAIDRECDLIGLQGDPAPPRTDTMRDAWRELPPAAVISRMLKNRYRPDLCRLTIADDGTKYPRVTRRMDTSYR
jgi:hypothetical protein